MDLGSTIAQIRKEKNWSQSYLARISGCTQAQISRFESEERIPCLPVLDRLSLALNINLGTTIGANHTLSKKVTNDDFVQEAFKFVQLSVQLMENMEKRNKELHKIIKKQKKD